MREQLYFNTIITQDFENKVRALCRDIYNIEWSGVVFYKKEGSFDDNTLIITPIDICLMDIGNTVETSFTTDGDVINYMAENDLLDCEMGLIHSHHNMSTFFSGTDNNTLQEMGKNRNHFFSLIVNNKGEYSCAITRKIRYKSLVYNTFGNEEVVIDNTNSNEIVQVFYMNIDYKFDNYLERIKEIKEKKTKEIKEIKENTIKEYPKKKDKKEKEKENKKGKENNKEEEITRGWEDYYNNSLNDFTSDDDIDFYYDDYPVDITDEEIQHLVDVILTLNINLSKNFNRGNWLEIMESNYDIRFNKEDNGLTPYSNFISSFIYSIMDGLLFEYDANEVDDILCKVLIILEDIEENPYIEIIKKTLNETIEYNE